MRIMGLRTGTGVAASPCLPLAARTLREAKRHRAYCVETLMVLLRRSHARSPHLEHKRKTEPGVSSYEAKEVPMYGEWKTFWARLFGGSHGWSRRDKVLEYVVHRIDDGANVREAVQEEYVRRMATQIEIERILADPRIIEGARERMRRELSFEDLPSRRAPRANRPEATTEVRWPEDGTNLRRSATSISDLGQEA